MVDILLAFRQESVSLMFEELITSLTDFDVFLFSQGENFIKDHFDILIVEPEILDVNNIVKKANTVLWAGSKPSHLTLGSEMPIPINYHDLITFLEKKSKQNDRMLAPGIFLDIEGQMISVNTSIHEESTNENKETTYIQLTEKETLLLEFLINNAEGGSRGVILKEVWGYDEDMETKTVETHVSKLRTKLETNLSNLTIKITSDSKYKLLGS